MLLTLSILLVWVGLLIWVSHPDPSLQLDFGLWPQMLVVLGFLCFWIWLHRRNRRSALHERIRSEAEGHAKELLALVHSAFSLKACSRCHESEVRIVSVSPNARSVELECTNCHETTYAAACPEHSESAQNAKLAYRRLMRKVEEHPAAFRDLSLDVRRVFSAPESKITVNPTEKSP